MFYIYKITNNINGKVYIGLTTTTIKNRWKNHLTASKRRNNHLYNAMRKYGIENFSVEEIDNCEDIKTLGNLERKYIKEYRSTEEKYGYNETHGGESNQLDANPRAKLTVSDVENIRMIYAECVIGTKECWELYKDRISYSAFEKVYEGKTWKSVMPEVFTSENKKKHKTVMKSNNGEKNGNALLTDSIVYEMRKYYVNHTLAECFEKYGKNFKTKESFRQTLTNGYRNVPMYSKRKNKWFTYVEIH